MGDSRPTYPRAEGRRSPGVPGAAGDCQCNPLRVAHGVRLAVAPARSSPVADRLPLLSPLADDRHLGAGPHHLTRTASANKRSSSEPLRRHHRQSIGEDDGKRGAHGYDGGKKVNGRKRHLLVDTSGLVLRAVVHPANISDRDGARLVLADLRQDFPRLGHLWLDSAYQGALLAWIETVLGCTVDRVKRPRRWAWPHPDVTPPRFPDGFAVLPRRWVV